MKARFLLFVLALCAAFAGGPHAQERAKVTRIGLLLPGSETTSPYLKGLYQGFADQGLVEGKNVSIDIHFARGRIDRLPAMAAELAQSGVDLIFTAGDNAARAAQMATSRIPIVVVTCDALAAGLVSNLRRPGGNLTGVTCINEDLDGKRVELLKEVLPPFDRLGVLLNTEDQRSRAELAAVERAARGSIPDVQSFSATGGDNIANGFSRMAESGIGAAVVVYDPIYFQRSRDLAEAALGRRIATVFNFREFVEAGGLMSYGPNVNDMCRQAARIVKKVVNGEPIVEMPMEQPTRFELVLNMKTAKALGVDVPASLISRVDDLIE